MLYNKRNAYIAEQSVTAKQNIRGKLAAGRREYLHRKQPNIIFYGTQKGEYEKEKKTTT